MSKKLYTVGLLLITMGTSVASHAARPSINVLNTRVNQLEAENNAQQVEIDALESRVSALESTSAELSLLVDPLREVCGGNTTKLLTGSNNPVSVNFRGNNYLWKSIAGGVEILQGDITKGFYPCISDVALSSNVASGISAYNYIFEIDGQALQFVSQVFMGDLVIEKLEDPNDPTIIIPGTATLGDLMVVNQAATIPSNELGAWWNETSSGHVKEKQITVRLLDGQFNDVARYTYSNCLPKMYNYLVDASLPYSTEMVTIACGSVAMQLPGAFAPFADWLTEVQGKQGLEPQISVDYLDGGGQSVAQRTFLDVFPTRYIFPALSGSSHTAAEHQFHFRANSVLQP